MYKSPGGSGVHRDAVDFNRFLGGLTQRLGCMSQYSPAFMGHFYGVLKHRTWLWLQSNTVLLSISVPCSGHLLTQCPRLPHLRQSPGGAQHSRQSLLALGGPVGGSALRKSSANAPALVLVLDFLF